MTDESTKLAAQRDKPPEGAAKRDESTKLAAQPPWGERGEYPPHNQQEPPWGERGEYPPHNQQEPPWGERGEYPPHSQHSRLAVLGEITRAIARGGSADDVVRVAMAAVAEALAPDVVSFATAEGPDLRFLVLAGGGSRQLRLPRSGAGPTEEVWSSGEAVLLSDLRQGPAQLRRLGGENAPPARAYLGVPAVSGSTTVGVLSVQSYQEGAFERRDVELLTQVGRHLGGAVVNGRRLARMQRKLKEHDRSQRQRTDFLVGVAHDMRSPLAGIIGFAHILEELEVVRGDPTAGEAVRFIAAEAQRLSDLVGELVDLGRVDLEAIALERERLDLGRLVRQAADLVGARHPSHRVVVRDSPGTEVDGDLVRLHRVMVNLIENAAVHGPAGGLITVEVSRQGAEAVVAVSDRGVGVPEGERRRIFDRFVRLDGSKAGTGLGLYLALGLVEAHDGSIEVEGAPGGGARFVVRLPGGFS